RRPAERHADRRSACRLGTTCVCVPWIVVQFEIDDTIVVAIIVGDDALPRACAKRKCCDEDQAAREAKHLRLSNKAQPRLAKARLATSGSILIMRTSIGQTLNDNIGVTATKNRFTIYRITCRHRIV